MHSHAILPRRANLLVSAPNWIENFRPDPFLLGDIGSGETRSAIFTFDVKDGLQISGSGHVQLKISAANGKEWTTALELLIGDRAPRIQSAPLAPCCEDTTGLAVELTSFAATGRENQIVIEWSTGTESDNAGFNIHRAMSADGDKIAINEDLIPSLGNEYEGSEYSFIDVEVTGNVTYYYWLESVSLGGDADIRGPVHAALGAQENPDDAPIPSAFNLAQNYPNPFNPNTTIRYDLPVSCRVRLEIFNVQGRRIAILIDGPQTAGSKIVLWNGKGQDNIDVSSGVYFYRLQAGTFTHVKKMTLLR